MDKDIQAILAVTPEQLAYLDGMCCMLGIDTDEYLEFVDISTITYFEFNAYIVEMERYSAEFTEVEAGRDAAQASST